MQRRVFLGLAAFAGALLVLIVTAAMKGAPSSGAGNPVPVSARVSSSCPVTLPNGHPPYDPTSASFGNGSIWVSVYPWGVVLARPTDVASDGSIGIKFPWYRAAIGRRLSITGRRIDAPAPPLRSDVPSGYHANFQASRVTFPTQGCWKVTGRVGRKSLTFVTLVIKVTGVGRSFGYG